MLSNSEMEAEAQRILDELKIDLRPQRGGGDLPVSMRQMVEIAKALSTNARILIMDEPTSALTAREIEDLFRIIRDLKSKGAESYISHTGWRNSSTLWTELPSCVTDSTSLR